MVRCQALVVVVAALLVGACDEAPKQTEPKKKQPTTTQPSTSTSLEGRPPHPNMANAAWGEKVAAHLGAGITIDEGDGKKLLGDAIAAFHQLEPGSEQRALDLAIKSWKRAPDDVTRGAALAVAAAAMVVDPTVEGYADRLTDAFGLSIYAGTVDASDATGQSCRALVGAAGGAVRQARTLIDLVKETPKLPDETRAVLALARDAVRDRSDAFYKDAELGLVGRPDSVRLRAALADHLLDLGLADEATAVVGKHAESPLLILTARAQLDRGQPGGAIALLTPLSEKLAGVDEPRRAEALFWLGLAHLEKLVAENAADANADRVAVDRAVSALETRPGWQREATFLKALVASVDKQPNALALLQPLTTGTPRSSDAIERRMTKTHLNWCATAKDRACVEKMVRRLEILDVDPVAVAAAREELDPPPLVAQAALLGAADPAVARQLLAVRRSIAADALSQTRPVLDGLLKDPELRVARALRVRFAQDPAETARFAAAAVTGKGPVLADEDLLTVADGLGAFKLKDSEALLTLIGKDASPKVTAAVTLARADLKDPESRKKRKAADHGADDDHGGPDLPMAPAPAAPKAP